MKDFAEILLRFADDCVASAARPAVRTEFEHVREAGSAFLLLRGHASALQQLVIAGPGTYPSGWPIARSMLEVGLRSAWRMDCDNPFEAEGRWLAWLGRMVAFEGARANAARAEGLSEEVSRAESRALAFQSFHRDMAALLVKKGVRTPKGEPPMSQVMKSLGLSSDKYHTYADASERLHGSYVGMEAYSRHLGDMREFGEFAEWHHWVMPLTLGMRAIYVLAQVFSARTCTIPMRERIESARKAWEDVRCRDD